MIQRFNPFKATLGATPPLLVGRNDAIENFTFALEEGPGAHERVSLVVGPRGIGKTALLNEFEDIARENGWIVISETATAGFVERIRSTIIRMLHTDKAKLSGMSLTILGIGASANWDTTSLPAATYTLRNALEDLLNYSQHLSAHAEQPPTGVLITLDEMHHQRSAEVVEFGTTIQHLVRDNYDIAVAMAGIPSAIRPLLASNAAADGNPVTFLRRAERIMLDRVSDDDVRDALTGPLTDIGITWEPAALEQAVAACQGYPFMIQLVGQWAYRKRTGDIINADAAAEGIGMARRKLGHLVHEPALADLSDVDRTFLVHMAHDDGPSKISDIAVRMGRSDSYAGNYRRRLLDAEMIVETGRGEIDFALPYLRDYLREHAVSLVAHPHASAGEDE